MPTAQSVPSHQMAVSNQGPPPLKVATYIFPWAKAGSPLFREFLLDPHLDNFQDQRTRPTALCALCRTDRSELAETSWLYLDLGECRSASAWVRCDTDFLRGVINVRCQRVPAIGSARSLVAIPSLGTCVAFRLSLLAPSCQFPPIDSVLVLQASDQPPFVRFWAAGERGH